MRKTIIAASAATLLALSACGAEDGGVDVDSATDAVATEVDRLTEGAGDAGSGDTAGSGSEAGAGDGENADGAEAGQNGSETTAIALPDGSEVPAPAGIAEKYEEIQATSGHLGAPVGETQEVGGGQMLEFEGGTLIQNPDGEAYLVQGVILQEYLAGGGPTGELGFPTTDETPTANGFISTFDSGEITFDLATEEATVEQG